MSVITDIEDLRRLARKRVPRMFYDYADSGSWSEGTYRANQDDFAAIKLRQRVARNIENRSLRTRMLGQEMAMPVAIAPTGLAGMQHADGEILAARAAAEFGVRYTLSTMSICSLEDIATEVGQPFWFQLYVMRDRDFIERLIDRAKAAGCDALVLTLDLQIIGQRHKDLKNGLSAPPRPTLANLLNIATKPRWALGMLGTRRRGFGNIVGHVKGVDDMGSLSEWTARQFDPRMPGVELKASPAKLLQGHNVFGPTCIEKGAEVMFKWLAGSYPDLFAKLDVSATQVYALDCTYSSRLPDERTALQVIQALTNVSNGHTKSRGDNYQTSAYWGAKESRLKRLKAYLKHTEFQAQLDELKRAGRADLSAARSARVMSDPRLQEWVRYLLRMEATVMHRWLERRGIPSRLVDLIAYQQRLQKEGRCLIQECWQAVTADLFAAFEGIQMRVIDDEKVLAALTE